jgi:hypothetical protein
MPGIRDRPVFGLLPGPGVCADNPGQSGPGIAPKGDRDDEMASTSRDSVVMTVT